MTQSKFTIGLIAVFTLQIHAEASEFTSALISDETSLQSSENQISVRLYSSADLRNGTRITLSGFTASRTASTFDLAVASENGTLASSGSWEQASGTLTVALARDVSTMESIKLRFVLLNPEADNPGASVTISCAGCAADGSNTTSLTKKTGVLQVSYKPARCQTRGRYGDRCSLQCQGIVVDTSCKCKPGQFGPGCSQTASLVAEASAVVINAVASSILLPGGQGVQFPERAFQGTLNPKLFAPEDVPVEVTVKLYRVVPQLDSAEELYGAGRAMTISPRGLTFRSNVTVLLDLDQGLVFDGFSAAAYRRSDESGLWGREGGGAEGGIVRAKVMEFGSGVFAAMAAEDIPAIRPAFTEALVSGETDVQGSPNELSVRVFFSWPILNGAAITLSGLLGSSTRSGTLQLVVESPPGVNASVSAEGQWTQPRGELVLTTLREVAASESIKIRFGLVNPGRSNDGAQLGVACSACLVKPSYSFLAMAPLSLRTSLLSVQYVAPLCGQNRHAEDCARVCYGIVVGRGCQCPPGRFGTDCELQGTELGRVAAVYDGARQVSLVLPEGQGLVVRRGDVVRAREESGEEAFLRRVELTARLFDVAPTPQWSQRLVPSGRALVLGPPGVRLAEGAVATVDLAPPEAEIAEVQLERGVFLRGGDGVWAEVPGGRAVSGGRLMRVGGLGELGVLAAYRFDRAEAPGVEGAHISGATSVQGLASEVAVRLRFNCVLANSSRITLSGLVNARTRTDAALPISQRAAAAAEAASSASIAAADAAGTAAHAPLLAPTAGWDQVTGTLVVTLRRPLLRDQDLRFAFSLLNPVRNSDPARVEVSCPNCNRYTFPGVALAARAVQTNVLGVRYVAPSCPDGATFYDCTLGCEGVVSGRVCQCPPGRFGFNCSTAAGTLEEASIITSSAAVSELRLPGGQGVRVPAGALAGGAETEVGMRVYDVFPAPPFYQALQPCGRAAVMSPHGLEFAEPVTLMLTCDPARVPERAVPSVHRLNPNTQEWEDVGGAWQGGGMLHAQVSHFSTFAVMAVENALPAPPTTPVPALFPPLGSVDDEEDGRATVIVAALLGTLGGLCILLALFLAMRGRRGGGPEHAPEEQKHHLQHGMGYQRRPLNLHGMATSNVGAIQHREPPPRPPELPPHLEYYASAQPYVDGKVAPTNGYLSPVAAAQLDLYAPPPLLGDAVYAADYAPEQAPHPAEPAEEPRSGLAAPPWAPPRYPPGPTFADADTHGWSPYQIPPQAARATHLENPFAKLLPPEPRRVPADEPGGRPRAPGTAEPVVEIWDV